MSIAALYDIHGNLPALEAVLEEVRTLEVDRRVSVHPHGRLRQEFDKTAW